MNVKELIEKIESNFYCMIGPPRAYFELPSGFFLLGPPTELVVRLVYESVIIIAPGVSEEVESSLCQTLFSRFPIVSAEDAKMSCLFWRRLEKIEISRDTDDDGVAYTQISTRLVIPGHSIGGTRW